MANASIKIFLKCYKRGILLCLFVFLSSIIPLQSKSNIDSILNLIETEIDTSQKIKYYLLLVKENANNFTQKSLIWANEGKRLAKLSNSHSDYGISNLLIANIHNQQSKFDSAGIYYLLADSFISTYGSKIEIARLNNGLGSFYHNKDRLKQSIDYYQQCEKIAIDENDIELQINVFNNLGFLMHDVGEFEIAIEYLQKSITLNIQHGIIQTIISSYNNMGRNYKDLKNKDLALLNYEKALEYAKIFKDSLRIPLIYYNISSIYISRDQYDTARIYIDSSNSIYQKLGDLTKLAQNKVNLGIMDYYEDNNDLAIQKLNNALNVFRIFNDYDNIINVLNNLGLIVKNQGKIDQSIEMLTEAMQLARTFGFRVKLQLIYNDLSKVYGEQEDYIKSYDYARRYIDLKDSLYTERASVLLAEADAVQKYKSVGTNKELSMLRQKEQLANLEIKRQRNRNLVFGITALSLSIIVLLGFLFFRNRQRSAKAELHHQEKIAEQQISEIIRTHRYENLLARVSGEESERSRLSSEIHDGLGGALAGISMQLEEMTHHPDKSRLTKISGRLKEIYTSVRDLSHSLAIPGQYESNFVDVLGSMLHTFSTGTDMKIIFNSFPKKETFNLQDDLEKTVYRIIQELMNNIVRHAKADIIDIQMSLYDHELGLVVEDNGIGFNPSGTIIQSDGLGLNNIEQRVKDFGGTYLLDTKVGRGTIVNISIPVES